MEVLIVGNTAYVDDDFCSKAFPGDHVQVVAAQDARRDESSPHASWKELLQHLDQAYEFERVVYLSTYLTPHTETFGDIALLRSVFRACMGRRVQLLFIAGPAGAEGASHDDDVSTASATQTGKGIAGINRPIFGAAVRGVLGRVGRASGCGRCAVSSAVCRGAGGPRASNL